MKPDKVILGIVIFLVGISLIWIQKELKPDIIVNIMPTPTTHILGVRSSECTVNGSLPDKDCTPGDVFPNVTVEEICKVGYTATVRNVTNSVAKEVYRKYGIVSKERGEYEVDHLISLELGGSNEISNLWPEAADPIPGFRQKDILENYLHKIMCQGKISLNEAQKEISGNWVEYYRKYNLD